MTKEKALKLLIGDSLFIYDPSLEEVFEGKVIGINIQSITNPKPMITAYIHDLGSRIYKPEEANRTEVDALRVQSACLKDVAAKARSAKFKVDRRIRVLS